MTKYINERQSNIYLHYLQKSLGLLVYCLCFINIAQAQDHLAKTKLDSLYDELETIFNKDDDITRLLAMADSLLLPSKQKYNALTFRGGYISKILSAGRDFGTNQFGAIVGATYIHKSGFYGDMLQYYNSGQSPAYYMTNMSAGYYWQPHKAWDVNIEHDFYFYGPSVENARFSKSAQVSAIHHRKYWDVGIDYSYLYGREHAHRVLWNTNLHLKWYKVSIFDRVSFYPGAIMQLGSNNVYFLRQQEPPLRSLYEVVSSGSYPRLTREEFVRAGALLRSGNTVALNALLRRNSFSPQQIQQVYVDLENRSIGSEVVFGIMNYALNFPLSLAKGPWGVLMSYTLNFPIALKGETYQYPINGFFTVSVSHTLVWGKG